MAICPPICPSSVQPETHMIVGFCSKLDTGQIVSIDHSKYVLFSSVVVFGHLSVHCTSLGNYVWIDPLVNLSGLTVPTLLAEALFGSLPSRLCHDLRDSPTCNHVLLVSW
jgi:hypothetical protein